jgi:hypothetical protein
MQKNICDMCKSSIFVFFEIVTKCPFLYSIIQKLMTWGAYFVFYNAKKHWLHGYIDIPTCMSHVPIY